MMLSKSRDTKIVTTLDAALQRQLEELAMNWKSRLPARSSLAMIVVDHTSMKVRGWVGSVDINDDSRFSHVDMVNAIRSPGSVLKPFIYGMALDDGLIHPASLLQDVPRKTGDYRPGNFDSGFHGPVSMSEALVRSLNLPAVQVLEAYGPKRFAGMLSNAGLPLILPAGAQPNLSLILGAQAHAADIAAAYSAFARQGKAGRLRLQPGDPLIERPLLSQGAAWIIRRILANEAQPLPDSALPQVAPLAWKTGTSYGYRDAWAIGLNARYVIGIWTGRPDGTPVAGQFGFASAVPLLNQVNNMLQSRSMVDEARLPRDPRPASVGRGVICWPGASPCLKGAKTVGVGCQPGCWKAVNRLRCCCRNRKVFAGSVSLSGWIKKANALRRIVLMRQKKCWMSGRCRWSPGCLLPKNGLLVSPPVQQFALRWITIMRRR